MKSKISPVELAGLKKEAVTIPLYQESAAAPSGKVDKADLKRLTQIAELFELPFSALLNRGNLSH